MQSIQIPITQIVAFVWLLLGLSCNNVTTDPAEGKVIAIADGDTFTLLRSDNTQLKIRLHGVDSPEKGQPYGANAKARLSELVFGKTVQIEEKDIDRYGRTVAIVYTAGNVCVNEQLLREGFVWHYKAYDKNPDWDKLEKEARQAGKGLWKDPQPQAPWQWRAVKRQKNPQRKVAADDFL